MLILTCAAASGIMFIVMMLLVRGSKTSERVQITLVVVFGVVLHVQPVPVPEIKSRPARSIRTVIGLTVRASPTFEIVIVSVAGCPTTGLALCVAVTWRSGKNLVGNVLHLPIAVKTVCRGKPLLFRLKISNLIGLY
jgi:hypothetical protein